MPMTFKKNSADLMRFAQQLSVRNKPRSPVAFIDSQIDRFLF